MMAILITSSLHRNIAFPHQEDTSSLIYHERSRGSAPHATVEDHARSDEHHGHFGALRHARLQPSKHTKPRRRVVSCDQPVDSLLDEEGVKTRQRTPSHQRHFLTRWDHRVATLVDRPVLDIFYRSGSQVRALHKIWLKSTQ